MRKVKPQVLATGASAVSAMAAALCCVIPLGAMLLGLEGFAGSAFFAKWRPVVLTVSLTLLALAWYFSYRKPRISCPPHTDCATPSACKLSRAMLLLATVLILAIAGFPTWSGLVVDGLNTTTKALSGAPSSPSTTLRVRIPAMDCAACAALIQQRIRTQTGILSADVVFQEKSATVRYDPSQITELKIITTINETGFKVEPTLELERSGVVSEAWLNRAGTVMAIVWSEQSKRRQRTKALTRILKEKDMTATELSGEPRKEGARDFQWGKGWYRGADVDRLSEEEAGVIANRWIDRFREKIVLTDEKAKILQEAFTVQLERQLTGKCTREETREELLKVARQNLDEKDIEVLLENFGGESQPKK